VLAVLSTGFAYPSLGPLLGTTFDKAVGIVVSRWKLLLIVSIVSIAIGTLSPSVGSTIFNLFYFYWIYASLANAVRLFDPTYKMNFGKVLTLIGVGIVVGVGTFLGFLALIVPGVWVANKLSLSQIIAVAEDEGVGEAVGRSWYLTTGAFWPTLLFNVVLQVGYIGVIVVGYIMLGALIALGFPNVEGSAVASTPLKNAAVMFADAVYNLSIIYAAQAIVVAQLFWYRALLQRDAITMGGNIIA
jgi:hypothetical protein